MRILLTVDPEIPVPPHLYGGIERIVAGLVGGLRRLGHEIGLVAHPESQSTVDAFFPWPGARSGSSFDTARNACALRRAVTQFQPDVLHSFSRLAYLAGVLPTSLPKIMSYQREPTRRTVAWANRLARGTLQFTGCSEFICRLGRQAGGKWTAIHNFVDLDKFTFVPSVPDDAPLVFLSRVESIKGPHLAIEVAKRAGRRLILAGNHGATPKEAEYWRDQIEPNLGRNGVQYFGAVNDEQKNYLLGQAAALVVPIQWDEPFGIVFIEALACGTPVVSWARGAAPEIVESGRNGFLARSVAELIDGASCIARLDRTTCRATADDRFACSKICCKYLQLYSATTD